jgi:8-oxo-dGTP pyrophosphatase MutT (NUDIX family)
VTLLEWNDIYDENRNLTGRVHRRGTPWRAGEYGLVVCVWVHDGHGRLLLTRRAKGKSFAGTWENSGGAAKAGEDSLTAIVRELQEETGIIAAPEEFELLDACTERGTHYDHYCLHRDSSKVKVILQPGETDGVQWATFEAVHEMIRTREICKVIGKQFLRHEPMLLERQIKD